MLNVKFKLLRPAATEPKRMSEGAAAFDLVATFDTSGEYRRIEPMQTELVGTGIALDMKDPRGFHGIEKQLEGTMLAAFVLPRSGLASKMGITLANSPGLIDPDYHGEIFCALKNLSDKDYLIKHGERMAQLIFLPVPLVTLVRSTDDFISARGAGGFGSTGNV